MSDDIPGVSNPFSQTDSMALAHHEIFSSYVSAGFEPEHAIRLTVAVISILLAKS